MPKQHNHKRNASAATAGSAPYAQAQKAKANSIFKMNTDLGQHILKNPGVAQAIVDKADLKQSDHVLEVGPGTGNLTVRILQTAKHVTAVEMDPRMAAELTKRVQPTPALHQRLSILLGDVIKTELPPFDVCISNTPYQISSPLVFKLLSLERPPRCAVLMFQKEFSARLFARPGEKLYSRLSVNAQFYAHVTHVMKVGRNNFNPPPNVESSVVRLIPKVPRPAISFDEWDGMLRVCFVRKNKTLRAAFLGTTSVLDMLTENYRLWAAQNDVVLDDSPLAEGELTEDTAMVDDGEEEWNGIMEVDEDEVDDLPDYFKEAQVLKSQSKRGGGKRKKRGRVSELVREKVRKVLENDTELAEKRARNCDEGDFLSMLHAFNKEGLHFG
ncbi:dimethyladenosine transferase [Pseudovirgaria hyperparasitica]|uniref:rRNA adenine N(6)-methyltransferase n=1 Tax=Pseudovirgaria hyperparasitica TaxID=470096 RepID=A0A6A6VV66_9PEZI|nr:dimethyladenosine transferase [Pseudovirgaria hyperparasitica]KAF2753614.1 dimethyladenosine transferase [Pseudovirgaria hyperparasitica]